MSSSAVLQILGTKGRGCDIEMGKPMLITLVASSLVLVPQINGDLQNAAREILAIQPPAAIGAFRDSEPNLESARAQFAADKARDLFGKALPEGWVHSFSIRKFGDPDRNKSAMFELGVSFLPSREHAKLNAMIGMSGSNRVKWPEPGLPDMTKKLGKKLGADQVWAWTGKSSWSAYIRVNRSIVHVALMAPRPLAKDKPAAFSDETIEEWEAYVAKVVSLAKVSSLNR